MEFVLALVLGVVQGLAEFLPISSSGHLRVIQDVIEMYPDTFGHLQFNLAFDTMLHVATVSAVIVYFRADLAHMIRAAFSKDSARASDRRLAWLVVVATIPTGLIGLAGSSWFETVDTLYVGVAFLLTSVFLLVADKLSTRTLHAAESLSWNRAIVVGIAQGIAIMPGISRSGATMSSALGLGLDREQAARFSFLLSVPIILLAGAKQALEVVSGNVQMPGLLVTAVGFIAAALTGYAAIAGLMAYIKRHSFLAFSVYTAVVGVTVIIWQVAA